ncbi:MAG: MlaE family ABC transporter permease, partial [Roseimicrobium sp.]
VEAKLVAESIVFGLAASWVMGVHGFGIPHAWFWPRMLQYTTMEDLICGMIKGFIFGVFITLISCHQGLRAENGAVGVGLGTTRAVVISSLSILVSNLVLSMALNFVFPLGGSN